MTGGDDVVVTLEISAKETVAEGVVALDLAHPAGARLPETSGAR